MDQDDAQHERESLEMLKDCLGPTHDFRCPKSLGEVSADGKAGLVPVTKLKQKVKEPLSNQGKVVEQFADGMFTK